MTTLWRYNRIKGASYVWAMKMYTKLKQKDREKYQREQLHAPEKY